MPFFSQMPLHELSCMLSYPKFKGFNESPTVVFLRPDLELPSMIFLAINTIVFGEIYCFQIKIALS